MIKGLALAAQHQPAQAFLRLKQALALLPTAQVSLRVRAKMLAALTRADEYAVMHLPLTEEMRWKRFLLAHHRVVRTEQMLWMAHNPLQPLHAGPEQRRWPINTIGPHAIVGLHALEYWDGDAFRWTNPVFLLRFLPVASGGVLTLETRNIGRSVSSSDLVIIVGGRVLSSKDIVLDDAGNIELGIEAGSLPSGEIDIVVIVREIYEPSTGDSIGRRLGLPLFSIKFASDARLNVA
jgi:hypothetical protein